MGKHRVYEIAKELGKTNQEVIDILAKNNIQVKSTLSTVDDTVRDLVVKNSARKPVQEKKAAPAPQHIVKKEPVKQAEAAPKQVQTQQNSAANTQRPQQQQGQRPNNQGQRPINQGPRPAAVNHQQGQNAGQNRPNQGISQQNRPNNQQGQRPQQQQGQRPNTQNQGQRFNQNRPNQGVNTQNRPNNQQGQRPQQGNRPQQRPQGGIYIGPRGQQPGQHNANAARPQQQGNARPQQGNMNNNNNARPQQGGTRPILLVLLVPIINLLIKMPVKINRRSKVLMQLKTAVLTAVIIIWDAVINARAAIIMFRACSSL